MRLTAGVHLLVEVMGPREDGAVPLAEGGAMGVAPRLCTGPTAGAHLRMEVMDLLEDGAVPQARGDRMVAVTGVPPHRLHPLPPVFRRCRLDGRLLWMLLEGRTTSTTW